MFPVALIFGLIGARLVFGFMGRELVALISLLHHHHRKSTIVERIAVTNHQLHLERVSPWGRRKIGRVSAIGSGCGWSIRENPTVGSSS